MHVRHIPRQRNCGPELGFGGSYVPALAQSAQTLPTATAGVEKPWYEAYKWPLLIGGAAVVAWYMWGRKRR